LEYRFDPPQNRSTKRAGRFDYVRRTPNGGSPLLPSANPFSIPASTLQESQSPVVRFVMLFVLFTIAGTILLMSRGNSRPTTATTAPKATVQQTLEPVRTTVQPTAATTVATPIATGPLASTNAAAGAQHQQPAVPADSTPPVDARTAADTHAAGDAKVTVAEDRGQMSDLPPAASPGGSQRDLPQVQIAEPQAQSAETPRAVAHLRGDIVEAPSHQANHDNHQSSLH
jgi:hypothetical protein